MRLISCHVENFGCLSDRFFTFEEGLTTIHAENGWGKSTLCTFLKAMFFGLEYSPKKKLQTNERKKYMPWQGGKFGGYLIFSHEGRTYRIERFFGLKDKEDSFAIYDQATGLPSRDFSDNPGEDIFGVDRDSFAMSMYFPQNQLPVHMSDRMNARIQDMDAFGGDIDRYEQGMALLEDRLKEYKKTGNRGLLGDWERQICQLEKQIKESEAEEEKRIADQKALLSLENELAALQEEFSAAAEKKEQFDKLHMMEDAKKEHILYLKEQLAKDEAELHPLNDFFEGGIPEGDDIDELIALEERRIALEHFPSEDLLQEAGQRLSREEAYLADLVEAFGGEAPKKEKFDEIQAGMKKLNHCETRMQRLSESFASSRKTRKQGSKARKEARSLMTTGISILAVIFALCLLGTILLEDKRVLCQVGMVASALLALCILAFSFTRMSKAASKVSQEDLDDMQEELEKLHSFSAKQKKLLLQLMDPYLQQSSQDVRQQYTNFSVLYADYRNQVKRTRDCQQEYDSILKEKEQYEIDREIKLKEAELVKKSFSDKYGMNLSFWNHRMLLDLKKRKQEYERLTDQLLLHQRELKESLEAGAAGQELSGLSLEEEGPVRERLSALSMRRQELIRSREGYKKEIEFLGARAEEASVLVSELSELKERYAEGNRRALLLKDTMGYLREAKEAFSAQYMETMQKGFEKYMGLIDPQAAERLHLDIDLHVKEEMGSSLHDGEYMSTGLYEFAGICTRLALIDAMYEREKPFLVLDDPFANLDENKVEKGVALIKELAKEYQIIYFTCHESRA